MNNKCQYAIIGNKIDDTGGVEQLTKRYIEGFSDNRLDFHVYLSKIRNRASIEKRYLDVKLIDSILRLIKKDRTYTARIILPDSRARIFALLTYFTSKKDIYIIDSVRFNDKTPKGFKKLLTHIIENIIVKFFYTIATYTSPSIEISKMGGTCLGILYNPTTNFNSNINTYINNNSIKLHKIVYLGRLEIEKGADKLPDIATELNEQALKKNLRFIIEVWGSGSLYESLLSSIESLNLSNVSTSLCGVTNDSSSVLKDATALILPSRSEGPSLSCAEAVSLGVPVVFTNVKGNGPGEISGPGGFPVPQDDLKEFAANIIMATNFTAPQKQELTNFAQHRYSKKSFNTKLRNLL